ncbi:hypothetical protein FRC08_003248 [Ceratobasidium sp. 394]|nr:hypothetical protein FRC08_003248 [Ceratobasidium sp. 394]
MMIGALSLPLLADVLGFSHLELSPTLALTIVQLALHYLTLASGNTKAFDGPPLLLDRFKLCVELSRPPNLKSHDLAAHLHLYDGGNGPNPVSIGERDDERSSGIPTFGVPHLPLATLVTKFSRASDLGPCELAASLCLYGSRNGPNPVSVGGHDTRAAVQRPPLPAACIMRASVILSSA